MAAPTSEPGTGLGNFCEAVEAHKAMVYSIAWRFVRDRAAAEELAQDVFLSLHRNWRAMKSPEHLQSWLRKVASHRAIDCVRKRRLRGESSLEETREPVEARGAEDTLLSSYLERMVASLPEKPRMVVVLRYQEGLEVDEIADVLGMKAATVKTQLARALEFLRAKTAQRLGKETA